MEGAREARRRKIVDRGSDRLAFITGLARTLPPPSPSTSIPPQDQNPQTPLPPQDQSSADSQARTLPPPSPSTSIPPQDQNPQTPLPPQDQSSADTALFNGEDDATDSVSLESKTGGEEELRNGPGVESEAEPLLPCKFQEPEVEPQRPLHPRIFTSTAINSSIATSENFRLLCSASIALLVILSHVSDPLGGNIINRSMPSRPLYLVLVTDITIVLGLLLCRNDGGGEKAVRETSSSMEVGGWENRLGMALVFQKAVAAIFMDCSVYVLLLVSGLSLLQ